MVGAAIDEFCDYPMPQKATNWTLPNTKKYHVRATPLRETNATRDIDGAFPGTTVYFKARRFCHKPNLFGTQDIAGATSPVLHPERKKPTDMSLKTSDIPRCAPGVVHLVTQRTVDPLAPSYALPSIHPTVKHFLQTEASATTHQSPPRDHMRLSDIQGTKAKLAYARHAPHDPLDYSDVPKHSTAQRSHRQTSTALVTADIVSPSSTHNAFARHTNPLSPTYVVPVGSGHLTAVIGEVPGSKSASPKPLRSDRPMLSLRSDDVDGARPGDPYRKKSYL